LKYVLKFYTAGTHHVISRIMHNAKSSLRMRGACAMTI